MFRIPTYFDIYNSSNIFILFRWTVLCLSSLDDEEKNSKPPLHGVVWRSRPCCCIIAPDSKFSATRRATQRSSHQKITFYPLNPVFFLFFSAWRISFWQFFFWPPFKQFLVNLFTSSYIVNIPVFCRWTPDMPAPFALF